MNADVSHKKNMKPNTSLLFAILAVTMATRLSVADTLYVATNGAHVSPFASWDNAATSINAAVNSAQNNDTVVVSNGTYCLTNSIYITNSITVISAHGANSTIVDGQNLVPCFELRNTPSTINGFTVTHGVGGSRGGGISIFDRGGTVLNCIVISNRADAGGGIFLMDLTNGLIRNCLITYNQATNPILSCSGGGVYIVGVVRVENCTIYNNSSKNYGGGLFVDGLIGMGGYSPTNSNTVVNTICYSNYAPDLNSSNYYANLSRTYFSFCNTSSAPPGIGNFAADPILANVPMGDFTLGGSSPCVNAGTNLDWTYSGTDLNGSDRVFDWSVDIGAYEASISSVYICNTGAIDTLWSVPVGAKVQLKSSTNLINPTWLDVGIYTSQTHAISIPDAHSGAIYKFYKLHWLRE